MSKKICERALHCLSAEVATAAGLSLGQLQQYAIGALEISPEAEAALARRMRIAV